MWWKLGGLGLIAAALLALLLFSLFAPVSTVDVTLDMPATMETPPSAADVEGVLNGIVVGMYAAIVAALGFVLWLMWRVVRRNRTRKNSG